MSNAAVVQLEVATELTAVPNAFSSNSGIAVNMNEPQTVGYGTFSEFGLEEEYNEERNVPVQMQVKHMYPTWADQIASLIKCGICLNTLRHPVMSIHPCHHRFCQPCVTQWIRQTKSRRCPGCRTWMISVQKDHFIENIIDVYYDQQPQLERPEQVPHIPIDLDVLAPLTKHNTTIGVQLIMGEAVDEWTEDMTNQVQSRAIAALDSAQRQIRENGIHTLLRPLGHVDSVILGMGRIRRSNANRANRPLPSTLTGDDRLTGRAAELFEELFGRNFLESRGPDQRPATVTARNNIRQGTSRPRAREVVRTRTNAPPRPTRWYSQSRSEVSFASRRSENEEPSLNRNLNVITLRSGRQIHSQ